MGDNDKLLLEKVIAMAHEFEEAECGLFLCKCCDCELCEDTCLAYRIRAALYEDPNAPR